MLPFFTVNIHEAITEGEKKLLKKWIYFIRFIARERFEEKLQPPVLDLRNDAKSIFDKYYTVTTRKY